MYQTLDINLSWKPNDFLVFLPILLALISFVVYWFTSQSDKVKARFYSRYDPDTACVKYIFFTKYFGFIIMGLVPLIIAMLALRNGPAAYGLTFESQTAIFSIVWILGLTIVVAPLAYISAKKSKNLLNYPQIRAKEWTRKTMMINVLGWSLYLFGYEMLFRGVLLFPLVSEIGAWPAIAVNIALYSATHIPKGLDETIGAIPLGLVLCILTLLSGTIWIAFFVHLAMALTNSLTALKFHPEIHYVGSKKKS